MVRSSTQYLVRITVAGLVDIETSRQRFSYYLASGLVEDRLVNAGFGRAKRLVIAVYCIQWRDIAVPNKYRFQGNRWLAIAPTVLL